MDDLISRQAAIDAIKRYESADSYDLNNGLILAMNAVADVPTIEPKKVVEDYCRPRNLMVVAVEDFHRFDEPKRCKWIYDKGLYRCTACNNLLTVAGWDIPEEQIYKLFKFCPNCGAKMERSEE